MNKKEIETETREKETDVTECVHTRMRVYTAVVYTYARVYRRGTDGWSRPPSK